MEVKIDECKINYQKQKTGQQGFQQMGIANHFHPRKVFSNDSYPLSLSLDQNKLAEDKRLVKKKNEHRYGIRFSLVTLHFVELRGIANLHLEKLID